MDFRWKTFSKKKYMVLIILSVCSLLYWFSLPENLFNDPYATVLQAGNGQLLSAAIAKDGQWRFPKVDAVPKKFSDALIAYEDKRFWSHPGVDPLSMVRALRQNINAGKIISGGSTISMQVIRLSRKNQSRTLFEKVVELVLATRLELKYSKEEILALYASHAPFGGNVVGLEAACWRYFGNASKDLSWGEAALLAVLPNAPSLIHPGKNRARLKTKRDALLDKLRQSGSIDEFTCSLAKQEPIPDEPLPLPQHARQLLTRTVKEGLTGQRINATIDYALQQRVEQIIHDHHQHLKANKIHNAAAVVLDVNTGAALAYVGNVPQGERFHGNDVDVITSPRSTGSILKPFLYAAMLDEGKILSKTLLPDIPVFINGFSPKNFSKEYDGVVNADEALIRSLNVPAVHMLQDFRYEKFHTLLQSLGMTTLQHAPDHYGLSLILGGAEGTLWDITGMYASMARTLNNYFEHPGKNRYRKDDYHAPVFINSTADYPADLVESSLLSASSIYLTLNALKELYRPGEESGWRHFNSARPIAWKTGTSFGFRDGWAIGVTPEYAIGVWVGNADGEGRPGLTGTDTAAPILFDIFSQIQNTSWFLQPKSEMAEVVVCSKSGYRASALCEETQTQWISKKGLETTACPYHKKVHLTKDSRFQINSACADVNAMLHRNWFVLPPVQEYYYRSKNISYKPLPPWRTDCQSSSVQIAMDLIYPKQHTRIFIPRDFDGKPGSSIFELAHRNPNIAVFWHLDGEFIGSTRKVHQLALNPGEGKHVLTVIDEQGETLERHFTVVASM